MTPQWSTTSGLPAGGAVIWNGRHRELLADGLDEWSCGRVELYGRLDVAPELVVLDALSFPWDALRPQDRDIPLVVALPRELDANTMPLVLGQVLLRHVTPQDRLIESRPRVRETLCHTYGLPAEVWLDGDTGDLDQIREAVRAHARRGLVEVTTDIGTYVVPEDDLITEQLREFGAHQRGDLNALLSVLLPDDIVLDIGAHVGTFAIPIARHLGPQGQVVAIEGHSDTFRLLVHNIEMSKVGDRARAHQVLLAASRGLPRSPVFLAGNTGGTWFRSASVADRGTLVPTPLDDWIEGRAHPPPPTVIKLDVEGAELEVLRGAEHTIAICRPLLMVEVSPVQLERHGVSVRQLEEWFVGHDFDLFVSTGARNTPEPEYRIEPLASLIGYNQSVFDVIAVPRESKRRPKVSP